MIAGFFGGFAAWTALAPLDSAAIAPGSLVVVTHRKTIQHLEGGIVGGILIREGSTVRRGDPLIRLATTQAEAEVGILKARLTAALARRARLVAERAGGNEVDMPEEILAEAASNDAVRRIVENQRNIFATRREALATRMAILHRRANSLREEIIGLRGEIAAAQRRLDLIALKIDDVERLVEKRPGTTAAALCSATADGGDRGRFGAQSRPDRTRRTAD